jgi:hypothetical protein
MRGIGNAVPAKYKYGTALQPARILYGAARKYQFLGRQ